MILRSQTPTAALPLAFGMLPSAVQTSNSGSYIHGAEVAFQAVDVSARPPRTKILPSTTAALGWFSGIGRGVTVFQDRSWSEWSWTRSVVAVALPLGEMPSMIAMLSGGRKTAVFSCREAIGIFERHSYVAVLS